MNLKKIKIAKITNLKYIYGGDTINDPNTNNTNPTNSEIPITNQVDYSNPCNTLTEPLDKPKCIQTSDLII